MHEAVPVEKVNPVELEFGPPDASADAIPSLETQTDAHEATAQSAALDEDYVKSLQELNAQLREKEALIQEQHKALTRLYAVSNEQSSTIERLTAEVRSHEEAQRDLDGPLERARSIERFKTQISQLEDAVETRGRLLEQYAMRLDALQSQRTRLQAQLRILDDTCEERMDIIEDMTREYQARTETLLDERAGLLSEIDLLNTANRDRLGVIEEMTREFEERTRVAERERANLQSQIDILAAVSGERLALIETMTDELNALRATAEERAEIIARLEALVEGSTIRGRIKRVFGGR